MKAPRKASRERPPLDEERLRELALRYVGRFATTRAKLRAYLSRKLREHGWSGPRPPDLDALANRIAELGYIDDAAYALSKSRALSARGYGKRRLTDRLRVDGVGESDAAAAMVHADSEAVSAALHFARRRRIGAFAIAVASSEQREKWIAAMIRAGHPFALAKILVDLRPGTKVDEEAFADLMQS